MEAARLYRSDPTPDSVLRRVASILARIHDAREHCHRLDFECQELEGDLDELEDRIVQLVNDRMARKLMTYNGTSNWRKSNA